MKLGGTLEKVNRNSYEITTQYWDNGGLVNHEPRFNTHEYREGYYHGHTLNTIMYTFKLGKI